MAVNTFGKGLKRVALQIGKKQNRREHISLSKRKNNTSVVNSDFFYRSLEDKR